MSSHVSCAFPPHQLHDDYIKQHADSVPHDVAIRLCCLEIRRLYKHLQQDTLDKISNMDYLDKHIGFERFMSKSILSSIKVRTDHPSGGSHDIADLLSSCLQQKVLRKLVAQTFKEYANLSVEECVFQFFEVLETVWKFDQESFACTLGVSDRFRT